MNVKTNALGVHCLCVSYINMYEWVKVKEGRKDCVQEGCIYFRKLWAEKTQCF